MIQPPSHLLRSLHRWDLAGVIINSLIGASIFGLPSRVFALLGSYSIFAFVLCALCAAVLVFCFAEVASRYSATGGPYLYARDSFGATAGFIVGWLLWIARITSFAANSNLLIDYFDLSLPGIASGRSRLLALALMCLILGILNVLGVRMAANASNLFAVAKLLPLVFFIVAGFLFVNPERFSFERRPGITPFSEALLLLLYSFTGFEMAVIPAGETRRPERDLPVMLIAVLAFVAVICIAVQVVCIGTLPDLATSSRPLADAAARFLGTGGIVLITAGLVISLLGNLNVSLLSASRITFAMSESGDLPRVLGYVNARFHTPLYSIVAAVVATLALSVWGSFIYLATLSSLARLVPYMATCAALPVLRRNPDAARAKFLLPAGSMIAAAGVVICLWLLSSASARAARDTLAITVVGLALFTLAKIYRSTKTLP